MREKQIQEAIKRLEAMDLHPNILNEFKEDQRLNKSEGSFLFWLTEEEKQLIKAWEEETGNIVYALISNNTNVGLLYSLLFVSKYEEEWERDYEDIKEWKGNQKETPLFAYVLNSSNNLFSEYGYIGIAEQNGGLVRIY